MSTSPRTTIRDASNACSRALRDADSQPRTGTHVAGALRDANHSPALGTHVARSLRDAGLAERTYGSRGTP